VRFDPDHRRLSSLQWTGGVEALNQFSDGYPLLVASEASLDDLNAGWWRPATRRWAWSGFGPTWCWKGVEAHDEDRLGLNWSSTPADDPCELQLVKPCARCPIPNVDPATGLSSPAVGDMLQAYRQDARLNGAVHLWHECHCPAGGRQVLRVGQPVRATTSST
jgi:uncharacterized protein YcbX